MYAKVSAEALRDLVLASGLVRGQNSVSWVFDCPLCHKKNKLYIRKSDGRFVCWVCKETSGFQGRPEYALTELLKLPIQDIRAVVYTGGLVRKGNLLQVDLKDFYGDGDELPAVEQELPEIDWDPSFVDQSRPSWAKAAAYLEKRGVTAEMARQFDLRYWPTAQRVVVPVVVGGLLRGWQARTVVPDVVPKIRTSEGLKGGRILMFQDSLLNSPHAILTEGPFDAMKASVCGGAVATMGKAVTQRQLGIVTRSGVTRIYLALDPDAASDTMRLSRDLHDSEVYLLRAPAHREDLGECTPEEVREAFGKAERWSPSKLLVYMDPAKARARTF